MKGINQIRTPYPIALPHDLMIFSSRVVSPTDLDQNLTPLTWLPVYAHSQLQPGTRWVCKDSEVQVDFNYDLGAENHAC